MSHFLTTVLTFADGVREGQVLHVGTEADCWRVADIFPAIACSGEESPIKAHVAVIPIGDVPEKVTVGMKWRNFDKKLVAAPEQGKGS